MGWCNNNVFGGRNTNMTFKNDFQNMEIAYNSNNIIGEVGGTHYNKYIINAYGSSNNPIKLDSSIIEHGIIYVTMINNKPVIYTSNDIYTAI
jgi:hypothetical protein